MILVIDASVTMAWCFEDEHSAEADRLLGIVVADGAITPPLWEAEVTNVLVAAERRGRTTPADSARFLALLDALPIEVADHDPSKDQVLGAAREHGLSAYDATYLVTAMLHGAALATFDERLAAAARSAGVRLA
ncbi:MAG: type II toxin-antitoxin system VapC family toxin [Austwickia sp.]|nr:type II toxin-antitoxin system VapC family toxin [Austwickia sp.]MCO5309910.1 type II toxin-antitoxin system VapC family toxin [Austwickia sp.]